MFLAPLAAEFAARHAVHPYEDERDAQNLPHVDEHGSLPCLLHLFRVFDEETRREDAGQAETEVEARAHLLRPLVVERVADDEKEEIADGFVELAGVAGQHVHALEDERPRHVGGLADDFRVHQIAQADEHGTGGRGDGHVVQHAHDVHLRLAHIEPQGQYQPYGAAMAGQPGIAGEDPPVGCLAHGEHHLQGMGEEVVRFVEQAVAQAGTHQDAHEAVEEERVEQFVGDVLLPVEALHQEIVRVVEERLGL